MIDYLLLNVSVLCHFISTDVIELKCHKWRLPTPLYFEYLSLLELSDPFHLQSVNNDDKYFHNDKYNDSNINNSDNNDNHSKQNNYSYSKSDNDNNNVNNSNYDNSNKENDNSNNCKNDEVFTMVISKILLMYQSIK